MESIVVERLDKGNGGDRWEMAGKEAGYWYHTGYSIKTI
jgi:hypothetical protein